MNTSKPSRTEPGCSALEPALELLAKASEGALATLEGANPYVSAVGIFYEADSSLEPGKVILLLSDLAQHTKNIKGCPQVSLLVVEKGSGPIHERRRLTAEGRIAAAPLEKFTGYKARYLKCFPKSEIFFTLSDFHFWEISIEKIHWYGGFGKASVGEFKS